MSTEPFTRPDAEDRSGGVWAYVSASRLNTWLSCPLKFKLKYIDGVREPSSPAMFLGKVVHRLLETATGSLVCRWGGMVEGEQATCTLLCLAVRRHVGLRTPGHCDVVLPGHQGSMLATMSRTNCVQESSSKQIALPQEPIGHKRTDHRSTRPRQQQLCPTALRRSDDASLVF